MEEKRDRSSSAAGGGFFASYPIIIIATIVVATLVIAIAVILTLKSKEAMIEGESDRVECLGLTADNCTQFKCVYHKVRVGPSCYMKKDSFGYHVEEVIEQDNGSLIRLKSISSETPYGPSLKNVVFTMTYLTKNILRFQFKDADKERYEVPVQDEFPLLKNASTVTKGEISYEIIHSNQSQVFRFIVKRDDGTELWDTRLGALLMSDKYLQIGSYLPSENIYGLGEHLHDTLRHRLMYVSWPMFTRDQPPKVPADHENLYGVHPFYTCLENSGKSHGVLFLNSNAMRVTFLPAPAVTFQTIGGILDFFIFVGDNPEHVVQLYTSLVGRPMFPPYWSLGFQLSRYGYKRLKNVQRILEDMQNAKIPLAVQYLDIDHMKDNMDFTYDKDTFPKLPEFIAEMKEKTGLKWVVILDPAIAAVQGYEPYDNGLKQSVFVKRSPKWKPSMFPKGLENLNVTFGRVWPPYPVAFPDFFLDETKKWWKDEILNYYKNITFDGLWIDMNEPANFGTNEDNPDYCMHMKGTCWSLKCPEGEFDDPPYNPLYPSSPRLSKKTLCMESVQGSSNNTEYLHYNVHSLYGWSQTQPTLEAAQEATGTRSLVISRSTYPSSGRYAGHWLGDNASTFGDLKRSIIGILEFNLFGIPYIGADVCGFFGDTTVALCKRWMQLGAFYPYFRNHNNLQQKSQEPTALGEEVRTASKKAIERRISLNPYLYTLFYKAHTIGSTVVRPVFHEFPNDKVTWSMDRQFMWGESLMIAPIVEENRNSVTVYLPNTEWWRFKNETSKKVPFTQRYIIETDADEYTPLYVRGGTILPYGSYDWDNYPENLNDTRNIALYIFPKDNQASGELFADDGISKDTIENEAYALYDFKYANCTLTVTSQEYSNFAGPQTTLEKLVVFKVASIQTVSGNYNFTMDEKYNRVIITLNVTINNVEEITWEDSEGNCQMMK